jgi:hypothetical protein
VSTTRINEQAVRRKAPWSLAKIRRESERTHAELASWEGTVRARPDERH